MTALQLPPPSVPPVPPVPPSPRTALKADPDFRRYWLARTVSIGGSMVTYFVMPVLVYRLTSSELWTAAVAAAEALPYLCFGLLAGALADRRDRKPIMIGADVLSALLLASVPIAYALGVLTPVHALAVGFGVQTLFVFFDAANFGALPAIAGRDRLPAANSAVFGTSTALELTVPAAAGALLAIVAPAALLSVGALTFVVSGLAIRTIRRPLRPVRPEVPTRLRNEIREGLQFLVRQPVVRAQTLIGIVVCMSLGAFVGQLVPWIDRVLRVPPDDWRIGAIFSAWGFGGLVASVTFPRLARMVGEVRLTLVLLPLAAVTGLTLFSVAALVSHHWLVATLLVAAWSIPTMIVILNSVTLRQLLTPDRLQSRVNTAARMTTFGLGTPIGAALGGVLGRQYGPATAMTVAALLLGLAAVLAWLSPMRRCRFGPVVRPED